MKLWNVSTDNLVRIVETVSDGHYDGNLIFKRAPERVGRAVSFTLTVAKSTDKGGRRSNTGRRIAAACWHAHRDVMSAIFAIFPDARLKTAKADYRDKDDFEVKFESTGHDNIGSQFEPLTYCHACEC